MRTLPVTVVAVGLALGPRVAAAQWGISAEIGIARFRGTSRDSAGTTVGPYDPTTFSLRLDHGGGRVRIALDVLHANPGLAGEQGDVTLVQHGLVSLWELAPIIAVRVARFGTGVQARVEAGPVFDLWDFDGEARNRLAGRGALALEWPLARSLTGSLRVSGAWSRSMVNRGDVPSGVERVATRRFGVAIGLRYGL